MGNLKEQYVKFGIPAIGLFAVFAPQTWQQMIPMVGSFAHAQIQAFGVGVVFAWATAWFAMKK